MEPEETSPEPTCISRGTYALYETPQGGLHLAFQPEGLEVQHIEPPAGIVKMIKTMGSANGNPLTLLRGMANGH